MVEIGEFEEIAFDKEKKKKEKNVAKQIGTKLIATCISKDDRIENDFELEDVSIEIGKILQELQVSLGGFAATGRKKKIDAKKEPKIKPVMPALNKNNKCVEIIPTYPGQTLKSKSTVKEIESIVFCKKPTHKPSPQELPTTLLTPSHRKKQEPPVPSPPVNVLKSAISSKSRYLGLCNSGTRKSSGRILSSLQNMPNFQNDTFKKLRNRVETAIRERKTFTVCGNYHTIRTALLARGWVEKMKIVFNSIETDTLKRLLPLAFEELLAGVNDAKNGNFYRRAIMSKLLSHHQVDFYWDQNHDCFRVCSDNVKLTTVNKFKKGIFHYTSKQGLCEAMKSAYWFQKPGISYVRYPRAYNLGNTEDPKDFISDFKLTACMALLKFVVYHIEIKQVKSILHDQGKVPINTFQFAIEEIKKMVRKCNHEDIDYEIEEAETHEWNNFLENFYRIVHIGLKFKGDGVVTVKKLLEQAKPLLDQIKIFWPSFDIDGMYNIWILKPANSCRGQGIHLCRTLQYVLKVIRINSTKKYVIQKYIEKPLLIHNTKFDIRQWFLISNANPLTIWIYKDSYIRFSSQLYSLSRLNEAIHLTNNSIQHKYKNCPTRSSELPPCNMWDSNQFKEYLSSIGNPNVFDEIIYPSMKEAITAAIIMNQGSLDTRKNCFELYGCDFMITEDFRPWLIEINSRPALFASTPVTGRLCPQVLEDLVKVIVDRERNRNASTGRFELLYKEAHCVLPLTKTVSLQLQGQQLPTSYFCNSEDRYQRNKSFYNGQQKFKDAADDIKEALRILFQLVQQECTKKAISNYASIGINTSDSEQETKTSQQSILDNVTSIDTPVKLKQSKSETNTSRCGTKKTVVNRSIFENVIRSVKNLAVAYQEYRSSYKSKA
ncbi:hypothetical protein RN001_007261 [Aquatica leii]|uniref:ATP-grasp domain-containing protein n=1 Tax=Aquatica leii TaxID=1421715 RepID=A0AAN7P2K3_9COLE|nr:hypothetical protein RN001_007261 [Aquatica leii]